MLPLFDFSLFDFSRSVWHSPLILAHSRSQTQQGFEGLKGLKGFSAQGSGLIAWGLEGSLFRVWGLRAAGLAG